MPFSQKGALAPELKKKKHGLEARSSTPLDPFQPTARLFDGPIVVHCRVLRMCFSCLSDKILVGACVWRRSWSCGRASS